MRSSNEFEQVFRPFLFLALALLMMSPVAQAADPLSEEQMMADIRRYESFGVHRYGSPGATAALDWIAAELGKVGLKVNSQPFAMERQYEFTSGTLKVGDRKLDVVPQWWIPEKQANFSLTASIAPLPAKPGDPIVKAAGRFVRVDLPYDRGAYLNDDHRAKLYQAFGREPAAVLLTIDHPSGEIFTYNVDQSSRAWPVPVILVAPKDRAALDAAEKSGSEITAEIAGTYKDALASRNVVARLDRGKDNWLVVSTPVTSWFTSTCERGPGIAGFLAMARLAAKRFTDVDVMLVATAGHEIGHGGMSQFMKRGAPRPKDTIAWAHFGASLACREQVAKAVLSSTSLAPLVDRTFAGIPATRLTGSQAGVGEMRDVQGAEFPNFFGMAGSHRYFHTPLDTISTVDPALLVPMATAFAETIDGVIKGQGATKSGR